MKLSAISNVAQLDHTMYGIAAQAGDGRIRSKDEFRPMVQPLLANRFQLKVHRETNETPVDALVLHKNVPKFKESAPDAAPWRQFQVTERDELDVFTALKLQLGLRL